MLPALSTAVNLGTQPTLTSANITTSEIIIPISKLPKSMHQSHLDFIKQRMCGLLSLLLPLENLATDVPQLGKDSVQRIVKSMTLEEKASLLVGLSMEDYGGEGSVAGHTLRYIPGSAGTTAPMPRYGIPPTVMADGPAGLRIDPVRKGDSLTYYCTAFPVGTMLASTWNTKLIEQVGSAIGNEVLEYGCDVILGPGMNIHRNPLCGRNFEYYSEDPLLSGKCGAAMVRVFSRRAWVHRSNTLRPTIRRDFGCRMMPMSRSAPCAKSICEDSKSPYAKGNLGLLCPLTTG